MPEKLDLTISLVLYNPDIEGISGLIRDISEIPLSKRLYLLDNSEQKTDLSPLENEYTEIIYSDKNLGYGGGHNICINKAVEACSDCHLIINPDIRFKGVDIKELFNFAMSDNRIGAVIPKVLYENGEFQYIYKMLPDPLTQFSRFFSKFLPKSFVEKRNYNNELRFKDFDSVFELPVVSGCFMFCKTKALEDVGGFDERFFMYMEDVDLSRRLGEKYKNMYFPDVSITHGFNKESYRSFRLMLAHIASTVKYFNKWGWFSDKYRTKLNKSILMKD